MFNKTPQEKKRKTNISSSISSNSSSGGLSLSTLSVHKGGEFCPLKNLAIIGFFQIIRKVLSNQLMINVNMDTNVSKRLKLSCQTSMRGKQNKLCVEMDLLVIFCAWLQQQFDQQNLMVLWRNSPRF